MPLIVIFSLEFKGGAEEMEWGTGQGDILTITESKGIDRNLITKFCQLILSEFRNSVTCYYLQPTKAAQKSEAIAKFLIDSLALHTKAEMYIYQNGKSTTTKGYLTGHGR